MHSQNDSDGTHPLDRIALALERIADCFEKHSRPQLANFVGVSDQCLPKCPSNKYDVIA